MWWAWDLSPFSFPTSVKWAHYVDDRMLTSKDLLLQQETADFAGTSAREKMGSEPIENSRPRHHHKVFENHLVGWDVGCPRSYDWKTDQHLRIWKRYKPLQGLEVFEGCLFPTWQCLYHLYCPVNERDEWDWASEQQAPFKKTKLPVKLIKALSISQAELPFDLDVSVTLEGKTWAP